MARAFAYIFVLVCAVGTYQFMAWAGWQFAAGVFFGVACYQCAHKYLRGTWIEF